MSSKHPVSRFREVVPVTKAKRREIRDPRFEETAGHLNPDLFKKSYAFVDDLKRKEKQLLQREAKKTKSAGKKAQLQKLLNQMVTHFSLYHTHTHIHTHAHAHTHAYTCTHTYTHTYAYTHTHARTHTLNTCTHTHTFNTCIHMHAHTHTCTRTHTHTLNTCTHTHTHTHTHTCTHTYAHMRTHTHTHTRSLSSCYLLQ